MLKFKRFVKMTGVVSLAYALVVGGFGETTLAATEITQTFEIEEATIAEMQAALQSGELTSVELVQMYLDRIEKYEDIVNAYISINPDALAIAAELDANRGSGTRGPLYGIPIMLKDNVDTIDDMPTTAGAVVLKDNYASEDAFIAKKFRDAGAIILGKSTMSEFANFLTRGLPNGFSGFGGQAMNPYGPGIFDTGGSSSGVGGGVAANLAAAGIGTETSGSILSPSSSNSLVGIKPTVGLVSRTGIIPLASSQDTAGPMTRTVEDAAAMLTVISGYDPADEVTATSEGNTHNYSNFLNEEGLVGARIGVDRSTYRWLSEEEVEIMENAIALMEEKGAIIIDPIELNIQSNNSIVLFHEFKHDLNAYLSKTSDDVPVKTLADIIAWNEEHPEAIPYGQSYLIQSQGMSDDQKDPDYLESRRLDLLYSGEQGIDKAFAEHDLDAILFPKNYGAAAPARAGYPSITVPGGYTSEGLPVGVTFSAMAYSEPKLIELSYAYEQASLNRVAPLSDTEEEELDVSELETLIEAAQGYSNEDGSYTEGSFAALQEAITVAEEALTTIETDEELNASIAALQLAIDRLEEATPIEEDPDAEEEEEVTPPAEENDGDTTDPVVEEEEGTPIADKEEDTASNDKETVEKEEGTDETSTSTNKNNTEKGSKLPSTATSTYTMLVVGLGLLLIGAITYFVTRRRVQL
ncbi:amidase family protein [Bacillus suaedae]|uniref:LPXTG cell wall anchor domain-containing protein n=1 Tax=Halalkalibacter suaedae TaxID=2822140 RepID=A0A940WYH5_9BACI|nr:LPXTG cell wall anchor domain-containing protein [Bacillus suaedae]